MCVLGFLKLIKLTTNIFHHVYHPFYVREISQSGCHVSRLFALVK